MLTRCNRKDNPRRVLTGCSTKDPRTLITRCGIEDPQTLITRCGIKYPQTLITRCSMKDPQTLITRCTGRDNAESMSTKSDKGGNLRENHRGLPLLLQVGIEWRSSPRSAKQSSEEQGPDSWEQRVEWKCESARSQINRCTNPNGGTPCPIKYNNLLQILDQVSATVIQAGPTVSSSRNFLVKILSTVAEEKLPLKMPGRVEKDLLLRRGSMRERCLTPKVTEKFRIFTTTRYVSNVCRQRRLTTDKDPQLKKTLPMWSRF